MLGVIIEKDVVVGTGFLATTNLEDNAVYFGKSAFYVKSIAIQK